MNQDIISQRNQDSVSPVVAVALDFANLTAVQYTLTLNYLMGKKLQVYPL